jgi:CheY-like chemotaxis protein
LLGALCPAVEKGDYQKMAYDAVLLDLRLQNEPPERPTDELTGYQALKRIHQVDPSVQVVLFTASKNALHVREMIDLEIAGYYPKEDSLPDPPAANWGRLRDALSSVLHNLHRREAFWALSTALAAAKELDWCQRGTEEGLEKLFNYVDHLQALVFLRETALPEPLEVRMKRHFIDSAHAVMDAALRLQYPRWPADTKTVELVNQLPHRSAVRQAGFWLNDTRNKTMHANRRDDLVGRDDHLVAISAACMVVSGGKINARAVLERLPRHCWPQWVPPPSLR